jgi:hypothetical protein
MGFAATPDGMLYVFGGFDDGFDDGGNVGEEETAHTLHMCMYISCTHTQRRGIRYRHMRMCARVLAYAACMSAPSSTRRLRACSRLHAASYALLATTPVDPQGGCVVGSADMRERRPVRLFPGSGQLSAPPAVSALYVARVYYAHDIVYMPRYTRTYA